MDSFQPCPGNFYVDTDAKQLIYLPLLFHCMRLGKKRDAEWPTVYIPFNLSYLSDFMGIQKTLWFPLGEIRVKFMDNVGY